MSIPVEPQEEQGQAAHDKDEPTGDEGQEREGEQAQAGAEEAEGEDPMLKSIDGEEDRVGAEAASNTVATDSDGAGTDGAAAEDATEGHAPDQQDQGTGTEPQGEESRPASAKADTGGPEADASPMDAPESQEAKVEGSSSRVHATEAGIAESGTEPVADAEAEVAATAEGGDAEAGRGEAEAGGDAEEGGDAEGHESAADARSEAEDQEQPLTALEGDENAEGEAEAEVRSQSQPQAEPADAGSASSRSRTPEQVQQQEEGAVPQSNPDEAAQSSSRASAPNGTPPVAQTQAYEGPSGPDHGSVRAIDVEVNQGPGLPYKMVQVVLDYSELQTKPRLGGYRNKRSGAVYHHACTQTPKAPKYLGVERKLERETQTVKVAQRKAQTVREAATQMERPGILIDMSEDRVRTPGRYQTSEERLAIVTRATCAIQRFWRGYQGRKRAAYLREKKQEREAFLRHEEVKAKSEAEEHRRREIERRMHPKTASDFEILYNELEAWRLQETRKIKLAGLSPDKEQETLRQLLHKETKLLQTIDRLKINANHENKEVRIQHTLTAMGKPKKFDLKNGKTVEVHTPFTTRAMELQQLYNGLNYALKIEERLDVLLHVKWTIKEFQCNLTKEIEQLINREADLLNRGRPEESLPFLRKRISNLFLTFIETPEFNPESSRFQIVPMEFEAYEFEKDKMGRAFARAQTVGTGTAGKWG